MIVEGVYTRQLAGYNELVRRVFAEEAEAHPDASDEKLAKVVLDRLWDENSASASASAA